MKIAAVAATLFLTAGGALVEAAALPKPSSLMGGNSQRVQLHHYVAKSTKQTSPEWGLRSAGLRSLPVAFHPYVKDRFGF